MLSSGQLSSNLGLSSIKLESPAYYCTSFTPSTPPNSSEPAHAQTQLISTNYGTLSLAGARSSPSTVAVTLDNSLIRVKRMRRMSSEEDKGVSDLAYYTGSPLGNTTWSHSDIDQATSIGKFIQEKVNTMVSLNDFFDFIIVSFNCYFVDFIFS